MVLPRNESSARRVHIGLCTVHRTGRLVPIAATLFLRDQVEFGIVLWYSALSYYRSMYQFG